MSMTWHLLGPTLTLCEWRHKSSGEPISVPGEAVKPNPAQSPVFPILSWKTLHKIGLTRITGIRLQIPNTYVSFNLSLASSQLTQWMPFSIEQVDGESTATTQCRLRISMP